MHQSLIIFSLLQLSVILSVEGVSMTINPLFMVVGSFAANPVTRLECRCSSDGTDNIRAVHGLEISRKQYSDPDFVPVAGIDRTKITAKFPLDMRSPNATGNFEHVAEGELPTDGTLIVTMDVEGLTCSSQAEFRCMLVYTKMGSTLFSNVSHVNSFTVITAPHDVRIIDAQYEENGVMKRLDNDKSLKVGTRIMYRCSANIGSDSNVLILWERSSGMGISTDFIQYIPAEPTDIVQDPVIPIACSYKRTSSMYYKLTSSDNVGISFHCKVRSYLSGEWYEPRSIQRRTVAVLSDGSPQPTDKTVLSDGSPQPTDKTVLSDGSPEPTEKPGTTTVRSDGLAIVLGVLLGACVVLVAIMSVCLHRYRKLAEELQPHPLNDNLNAYDRLNMTVGHSQAYDMLERNNSGGRSPEDNRTYIDITP